MNEVINYRAEDIEYNFFIPEDINGVINDKLKYQDKIINKLKNEIKELEEIIKYKERIAICKDIEISIFNRKIKEMQEKHREEIELINAENKYYALKIKALDKKHG